MEASGSEDTTPRSHQPQTTAASGTVGQSASPHGQTRSKAPASKAQRSEPWRGREGHWPWARGCGGGGAPVFNERGCGMPAEGRRNESEVRRTQARVRQRERRPKWSEAEPGARCGRRRHRANAARWPAHEARSESGDSPKWQACTRELFFIRRSVRSLTQRLRQMRSAGAAAGLTSA